MEPLKISGLCFKKFTLVLALLRPAMSSSVWLINVSLQTEFVQSKS